MSTQLYMAGLGATRMSVGLSQVLLVKPSNFQTVAAFKIFSGGTLEVVRPQLSGASTAGGGSSLAWGNGYVVGATEIVAINTSAAFYLAASGSTVVICALIGYTNGVTLPL